MAWLKIACGVVLVGLLLWQAAGHEAFARLRSAPPRALPLAGSLACVIVAMALVFVRWRLVCQAAGLVVSLGEAMRLGAIGYALNFVALGSIGGDVAKAALLARPRPGSRAAAFTTVVVDRLMGLLGMLLYASAAILFTGSAGEDQAVALRVLSRSTLVATAVVTAGLCLPLAVGGPLLRRVAEGAPAALGGPLKSLAKLASAYRGGVVRLAAGLGVGLVSNAIFLFSFYLAAKSLPLDTPSLAEHVLVVPLALLAGALPISPSGLGTIEASVEALYRTVDPAVGVGDGTFAALTHRLVMLTVGIVAVATFYATGGRRLTATVTPDEIQAADTSATSPEGSGSDVEADANPSRQTV